MLSYVKLRYVRADLRAIRSIHWVSINKKKKYVQTNQCVTCTERDAYSNVRHIHNFYKEIKVFYHGVNKT